jgi:alpha-ketoglutarate-dependent taurine dioxygenase
VERSLREPNVSHFSSRAQLNRRFTKKINELAKDESDILLEYLHGHIAENHDLQVRFRWEQGSFAIWDNRTTQHCATLDFEKHLARSGERAMSVGEAPYFDPSSTGRQESLGLARGIA